MCWELVYLNDLNCLCLVALKVLTYNSVFLCYTTFTLGGLSFLFLNLWWIYSSVGLNERKSRSQQNDAQTSHFRAIQVSIASTAKETEESDLSILCTTCRWVLSWISNNFHGDYCFCNLQGLLILKLTVVSFLLEQLNVVMLAVEFPLVYYVARWANSATAIGAFEAAPVVCSSIHRNLAKL